MVKCVPQNVKEENWVGSSWQAHKTQINQTEQFCKEKKKGCNSNTDSGGKWLEAPIILLAHVQKLYFY